MIILMRSTRSYYKKQNVYKINFITDHFEKQLNQVSLTFFCQLSTLLVLDYRLNGVRSVK